MHIDGREMQRGLCEVLSRTARLFEILWQRLHYGTKSVGDQFGLAWMGMSVSGKGVYSEAPTLTPAADRYTALV